MKMAVHCKPRPSGKYMLTSRWHIQVGFSEFWYTLSLMLLCCMQYDVVLGRVIRRFASSGGCVTQAWLELGHQSIPRSMKAATRVHTDPAVSTRSVGSDAGADQGIPLAHGNGWTEFNTRSWWLLLKTSPKNKTTWSGWMESGCCFQYNDVVLSVWEFPL